MKKLAAFLSDIFLLHQARTRPKALNMDLTDSYRRQHDHLYVDTIQVIFSYTPDIKKMIHNLKYHNHNTNTKYLATTLQEVIPIDTDYIVYPPIHWLMRLTRGKNHMKKISKYITTQALIGEVFVRKKNNHQARLTKKDRKKNAEKLFRLPHKKILLFQDKKVVIIDDVISTGSTANQLARLLKEAGAKSVGGYFLTSSHSELAKERADVE